MKITLVSLAPYQIRETRPSCVPFEYILEPSDGRIPSVLVIDNAKSALYLVERPETFPVPVPAEDLAKDLVEGHLKSQVEYDDDAHPAFFWVVGNLTPKEVLEKHADTVKFYLNKQIRWFSALVKAADDNWSRNKQRRMISDKFILAANKLGLKKEWTDLELMPDTPLIELIDCPYCAFRIPAKSIVCMNCKSTVNQVEKDKLDLKTKLAKVG